MALNTLIPLFASLLPLLHAQFVPVGSQCQVDECLLSIIPTYEDGTAPWDAVINCIDWQAIPVTST